MLTSVAPRVRGESENQTQLNPLIGFKAYEIIRRRLFQTLDADGERARDETVKAFGDLYKNNSAEFPPEAKEARIASF